MAKSLRAKCKKPHKIIKRTTAGTAYQVTEAARLQRLNTRLSQKLQQPVVREENNDKPKREAIADAGDMQVEPPNGSPAGRATLSMAETKTDSDKVSTSGSRDTSKGRWRKSRGITQRAAKASTTFRKKQAFH